VPTTRPAPSEDTALVLALAGTAVLFSGSPESEAEHWLRILRLHGKAGRVLQALGVGEEPLEGAESESVPHNGRFNRPGDNLADMVTASAEDHAAERGAATVCTLDVLQGVLAVYGDVFDAALYSRGVTREELLERIAREAARK
jgi:hypothetical protein